MTGVDKERLIELHQPHWSSTWVWLSFGVAFFSLQGLLGWCLASGFFWPVVPLVLVLAHLMHAHLIAFHEAAHGTLCPSRFWNDLIGRFIGLFSFMSLTAYRTIHHGHHAYLATERDEELWPFVNPSAPRWFRRLAAVIELTCGLAFTPFLFMRSFLRKDSPVQDTKTRRIVWAELASIVVYWAIVLTATALSDTWLFLLVCYLAPAVLAGNMQSLRKYIEHVGLTADGWNNATRSIVAPGVVGRVVAFSLFNEPYHGVHHKYARLPQDALPEFLHVLQPEKEGDLAPFPNYRSAFVDLVRKLGDPKVGIQWQRDGAKAPVQQ